MEAKIVIILLPFFTGIGRGMLSSTVGIQTSTTNHITVFSAKTDILVGSAVSEQSNSVNVTTSPTSTISYLMSTLRSTSEMISDSLNTSIDSISSSLILATVFTSSKTVTPRFALTFSSSIMSSWDTINNGTIFQSDKSTVWSNKVYIPASSITRKQSIDHGENSCAHDTVTISPYIRVTASEDFLDSSLISEITPTVQIPHHTKQEQSSNMYVSTSDSIYIITSIQSIYKATTLKRSFLDSIPNITSLASTDPHGLSFFTTSYTRETVRESKSSRDMFLKPSVSQITLQTVTPRVDLTDIKSSLPNADIFQSIYIAQGMKSDKSAYAMEQKTSILNVSTEYVKESPTTQYMNYESHLSSKTDLFSYQDRYVKPSASSKMQQTELPMKNQTFSYTLTPTKTTRVSKTQKKLYSFSYEIEFTGECKTLESKEALAEIWSSLMNIVGHESGKGAITIQPINILCGPLRLAFRVYNSTHKNLTLILQNMVNTDNFIITVILDEYKLKYKAIRIYTYSGNALESGIYLMGLNEVDIIVIICATTISVILVCAGLVICAREYYLKKRTRSFTLSSFMSKTSKSYDYTLTKMPRPSSIYSENGVRMKSMGGRDGQKTALLSIEEQETSVSDIQVRVNSNDDGIIVGVTGTGKNTQSSDLLCENGDPFEERLCPQNADSIQSVDNPIYYADDERFVNV